MSLKSGVIAAIAILLGTLTALCLAWWRNDWDLEAAAWVGDAVAPLVGALSLLAVAAALWSIHLQRDALDLQHDALKQQEDEIREQVRLQSEALIVQREALGHQIAEMALQRKHDRDTALRAVYGPYLGALVAYILAVSQYENDISDDPEADVEARRVFRLDVDHAAAEVRRLTQPLRLLDGDKARDRLRILVGRPIHLTPALDTPENHRAFCRVIHYEVVLRTNFFLELSSNLKQEFGIQVVEEDVVEFAKKAAEKERSNKQLEAMRVESEAVLSSIEGQLMNRVANADIDNSQPD